jgi:hypothetical protein
MGFSTVTTTYFSLRQCYDTYCYFRVPLSFLVFDVCGRSGVGGVAVEGVGRELGRGRLHR